MSYLVPRFVFEEIFPTRTDWQVLQVAREEANESTTHSRTEPWDQLWIDVGGEG